MEMLYLSEKMWSIGTVATTFSSGRITTPWMTIIHILHYTTILASICCHILSLSNLSTMNFGIPEVHMRGDLLIFFLPLPARRATGTVWAESKAARSPRKNPSGWCNKSDFNQIPGVEATKWPHSWRTIHGDLNAKKMGPLSDHFFKLF